MQIAYFRDFNSSNIGGIAYDDGKLFVEFLNLKRFAYPIPATLFLELKAAKSIGTFFSRNIKGKFPVAWQGWRCDLSPCQADATVEGLAFSKADKFRVCDRCAKTGPFARITFTAIQEQKNEG